MLRKSFLAFLPLGLPWRPLCAACDRFAPSGDGADETIRRMLDPMEQESP